jgi:predicted flap endonuclease-1-like 5' DNA nuclease
MYSIDLTQIPLDEFAEILTTADLLPSRRILLDNLADFIQRLKQKEIDHLAALRDLLRNKKRYPELAEELAVDSDYLTVLNREINSYVSKSVPLAKLDIFSEAELARLAEAGLKSTKDLYAACLTSAARQALAEQVSLPLERLVAALKLTDLIRITGVGPVYAQLLRDVGIHCAADFLQVESQELVDMYRRVNAEKEYTKVNLGLNDVEYCKRFCKHLEMEIEW